LIKGEKKREKSLEIGVKGVGRKTWKGGVARWSGYVESVILLKRAAESGGVYRKFTHVNLDTLLRSRTYPGEMTWMIKEDS